jgi:hypothetical protein
MYRRRHRQSKISILASTLLIGKEECRHFNPHCTQLHNTVFETLLLILALFILLETYDPVD